MLGMIVVIELLQDKGNILVSSLCLLYCFTILELLLYFSYNKCTAITLYKLKVCYSHVAGYMLALYQWFEGI